MNKIGRRHWQDWHGAERGWEVLTKICKQLTSVVSGMKKVRLGYLMGEGRWSLMVRVEKVSLNDILSKALNDLKRTAWLFVEVLAFQVKGTECSKALGCEAWMGV